MTQIGINLSKSYLEIVVTKLISFLHLDIMYINEAAIVGIKGKTFEFFFFYSSDQMCY
jgi:hypothetical protein